MKNQKMMKSNSNIPQLNTFNTQEGSKGRPFLNTAVQRVPNTIKWIGREEKSHWLHIFKYIDDNSCFALELDYYGKIVKVIKQYEF